MVGHIHYVKDLPPDSFVYDDQVCLITLEAFDAIADYTRSQPTGASPGRIYKKNLHWSGPPANWFIYVCVPDGRPGWTQHDGRPAIIV